MKVYAGGAIDYVKPGDGHTWRHGLPGDVFCPICENATGADALQVIRRNTEALLAADRAVFLLDGTFTVGTPIEISVRLEHAPVATVAIVHPGVPGVYVRFWGSLGVPVLGDLGAARRWLLAAGA